MSNETAQPAPNRCRIVLIASAAHSRNYNTDDFARIFAAGDVASIIFTRDAGQDEAWPDNLKGIISVAQAHGIAAIVDGDTQTAGRAGADGIQLGQDPDALAEAVEKFTPRMIVGAANVKTRHNALVLGDMQPDYLMFGKPGGDIRAEPHPKNIDLGQWWAAMVEIPGIVLGGNNVESVADVAATGVDFVALGNAIFMPDGETTADADTAAQNLRRANDLLDEHAPPFVDPKDQ